MRCASSSPKGLPPRLQERRRGRVARALTTWVVRLKDAMGVAQGMFASGGNLVQTGTQSQLGAAGAQGDAAGIVAQSGQLQAQSGQLHGQAGGQLQATQAGVYADAGGLYGQAGNLTAAQSNAYTNAGQLYGQAGALSVNNANALVAYGTLRPHSRLFQTLKAEPECIMPKSRRATAHSLGVQNLFGGGGALERPGGGVVGGSPDSKGIKVGGAVKPW